jgi:hypothetical protein
MSEKYKSHTISSSSSSSSAAIPLSTAPLPLISLDELLQKKSQLDDELRNMEKQIFELEENYLGT